LISFTRNNRTMVPPTPSSPSSAPALRSIVVRGIWNWSSAGAASTPSRPASAMTTGAFFGAYHWMTPSVSTITSSVSPGSGCTRRSTYMSSESGEVMTGTGSAASTPSSCDTTTSGRNAVDSSWSSFAAMASFHPPSSAPGATASSCGGASTVFHRTCIPGVRMRILTPSDTATSVRRTPPPVTISAMRDASLCSYYDDPHRVQRGRAATDCQRSALRAAPKSSRAAQKLRISSAEDTGLTVRVQPCAPKV
jgi:hypothetical protein